MNKEKYSRAKKSLLFGILLLLFGGIGRYFGFLNFVVIPWRPHYLSTTFIVAGIVWILISLYYLVMKR